MFMDIESDNWEENINAVIENTTAGHHGIKVVEISMDHIVLEMTITDKSRQPMGLLHGGVRMVIAETAASLHAGVGVDLSKKVPVGIEINGTHVSSASEGVIRAVGKVIRRTRKLIFHQIDIYHKDSGKLLTTSRVTNYYRGIGS
jgi:1,4-dihydroxy-2-naphthoyl-CoA hydrolase